MELAIVLTSRGNYAKFKKIIELATYNPKFTVSTIVGGELVLQDRVTGFFDFPVTKTVYFNIHGDTLGVQGKSTALAINEFVNAFEELKPDLIMLVGDRYETFAAAVAGYMCNIPIAHLEGGEISGTLDNSIRFAISELSKIHFPCTEKSAKNLSKFKKVYTVGSTSIDSITKNSTNFNILSEQSGIGSFVDITKKYLLVIYHPDTKNLQNTENELNELITTIEELQIPTIWLNANMDAGSGLIGHILRKYYNMKKPTFIHFFKSLPIRYYGPLLSSASCIVGNSSSGIREGAFLGTPNVTIGKRQEGRELCRNTLLSQCNYKEHIQYQLEHGKYEPDYTYGDGTASEKIMEYLCTLA